MEKAKQAIMQLKKGDINIEQAFETMTKEFSEKVGTTRVSLWSFNALGTEIFCHKLYDQRTGGYIQGFSLKEEDFPDYFNAVQKNMIVSAPDAATHSATKCFDELYFLPNDIRSLLDIIIMKDGKLFGVLCCENCDQIKNWDNSHIEYLQSASAIVTFALNSSSVAKAA